VQRGVDPNYSFSYPTGVVTVAKAPLAVTASSPETTYGTVPVIAPGYSGFVNGDSAASLTTPPTCSTTDVVSSTVAGSPYASSCAGAVDPNYTITTARIRDGESSSPNRDGLQWPMTYGGTVPTITPGYSGFENGTPRRR